MPRARKPSYASMKAKLAKALATSDLEECEELRRQIETIKWAEVEEYPEHFQKSDVDKARLLLFGWFEGGVKALVRHCYPQPGSFLFEECQWSLVAILRRGPPADILSQVASLFVPDNGHPLVEQTPFVALIQRRSAGTMKNVYAVAQIIAAVAAYERKGDAGGNLGRDAAVEEVADRYAISREYVYECLRSAPSVPVVPTHKSSHQKGK